MLAFVASASAVDVVLHGENGKKGLVLRGRGETRLARLGGTARVSVVDASWNATLDLVRDARFLGANYREVVNGKVLQDVVDRRSCHYSGYTEKRLRVVASTCGGTFRAVAGRLGERRVEIGVGKDGFVIEHHDDADTIDAGGVPLTFGGGAGAGDDGWAGDFSPPSSSRRRLRQGECGTSASLYTETKYAAIVNFNDAARTAELGVEGAFDEAALVFAQVFDLYASRTGGTLDDDLVSGGLEGDGSIFQCDLRPLLVGQVAWVDENPSAIRYAEGAAACSSCCVGAQFDCAQTCGASQVSSLCLLDSITTAAEDWRSEIESTLLEGSTFDVAFLLTGRDLDDNTVGIAYIGGICRETTSGAVVSSYATTSTTRLATVAAHELGHLLDMEHDQLTQENIMAATSTNTLTKANLRWSDESREDARDWFSSDYGPLAPTCLDDVVEDAGGPSESSDPRCGDGVVEGSEECDPGVGVEDACCTSDCLFASGCECATTDGCCGASGRVAARGTACRSERHGSCDLRETCDGVSSQCPLDLFAPAGTACVSDVSGRSGACFRGDCVAADDKCAGVVSNAGSPAENLCSFSTCSSVGCSEVAGSGSCYLVGGQLDGAPCGSNRMCLRAALEDTVGLAGDDAVECVPSVRFYRWEYSGSCDDSPTCVDELGDTVDDDGECDDALRPAVPGECTAEPTAAPTVTPSTSPAPSSTMRPTPSPSRPPTPAPSASFQPTPAPAVPGAAAGSSKGSSSSNGSLTSRLRKLGFAVQIAVLVGVVLALTACCVLCSRRSTTKYGSANTPNNSHPAAAARHPGNRRPTPTDRADFRPDPLPASRARYDYDDHSGLHMNTRPPPPSYPPHSLAFDSSYSV